MFILFSISSGMEFWLVNHCSIYESKGLKNIKYLGELATQFIRNKCIQDSWIFLITIVDNIAMDYSIYIIFIWGKFSYFCIFSYLNFIAFK